MLRVELYEISDEGFRGKLKESRGQKRGMGIFLK